MIKDNFDKSEKIWKDFFNSKKSNSNTKFFHLLKKKNIDNYTLTRSTPEMKESGVNDFGWLQGDFINIRSEEDSEKHTDIKTRLAIAFYIGVDFSPYLEKYGEEYFINVLDKVISEGDYELYGIEFKSLLKKVIEKEYIDKAEVVAISFSRGVYLGGKYENGVNINEFNKRKIRENKIKVFLGI